jgi:hypothetical protein
MTEMLLEAHDVIDAVPPNRSDQPLRESHEPKSGDPVCAHRCEAPNESLATGDRDFE